MNGPAESLQKLLRSQTGIWRGLRSESPHWATLPTGFAELDALLPGGGWPLGALMEALIPCLGIGELGLLLPAMAKLSQAGRHIVWVAPPHQPYAPALVQAGIEISQILILNCQKENDIPWALEKLLRNRCCGMALAWPEYLRDHQSRRLQLAAAQGRSLGVLFPQRHAANNHAALRVQLSPKEQGLSLTILKARGNLRRESVLLHV